METAAVIKVLELAVTYGIPAVKAGIAAMQKDTITLADVDALEGIVKRPEDYFHSPNEAA